MKGSIVRGTTVWLALSLGTLAATAPAAVALGISDATDLAVTVSGISAGDVVTEPQLTLIVEPVGYELSTADAGGENVDGHGHFHVHVDGALAGAYTEPTAIVDLSHLEPGPHTLAVMPALNDHTELSQDAVTIGFEYEPIAIEAETVEIALREWALVPSELTLSAGTYTFVALNAGTIDHSLLIVGEDVRVGTPDARFAAGLSESFTVDLVPGTYEMLCPLPWHKGTGMVGTLTVVP